MPRLLASLITLVLLAPAAAAAAEGEQTPLNLSGRDGAAHPAASPGGGGGLVRTIVGLAIVLAVIYGLHWVLKQVKSSRDTRELGTGLETLASLPLATNRSLHLVRAGHRIVLVGAGDTGVTHIRSWTEAEARAEGLLAAPGAVVDAEATGLEPAGELLPGPGLRPALQKLRQRTVIR